MSPLKTTDHLSQSHQSCCQLPLIGLIRTSWSLYIITYYNTRLSDRLKKLIQRNWKFWPLFLSLDLKINLNFKFVHLIRRHFFLRLPPEHSNYFGTEDKLGAVAVSIRREKLEDTKDLKDQYQYRLIVRTSEVCTDLLMVGFLDNEWWHVCAGLT